MDWKSAVCSRSSTERKAHSSTILSMLHSRYFLPLYAATEAMQKAVVGDPVPVDVMRSALRDGILAGFIGPLSQVECQNIFADWKKSQRESLRSQLAPRNARDVEDGSDLEDQPMDAASEMESMTMPTTPSGRGASKISKSPQAGLILRKRTEDVCRRLAKKGGFRWREWWSFLGEFLDISTPYGLAELEAFLANSKGLIASFSRCSY